MHVCTYAGKEPWANLLALINEKSTADLDIKAKAMSLINRVSPCHDYALHVTHHRRFEVYASYQLL